MALRATRIYADILGVGDEKARVTRQYAEVLTSGLQEVQVGQQYVEVLSSLSEDALRVTRFCVAILGDPPDLQLRHELDFTQEIHINQLDLNVESILSLDTEVDEILKRTNYYPENSLSFTSIVGHWILKSLYEIEHNLAPQQEFIAGIPRRGSLENQLEFGHSGGYVGPRWLEVEHELLFEDFERFPEVFEESISSQLDFVQNTYAGGSLLYPIYQTITFTQFADPQTKTRFISDEIELLSGVDVEKIKIVEQILVFEQTATEDSLSQPLENEINFVQTLWVTPIKLDISQPLTFEHSVYNSVKSIRIEHEIDLVIENTVVRPWTLEAEDVLQHEQQETNAETGEIYTILTGLQDSATITRDSVRTFSSLLDIQQTLLKVKIKHDAIELVIDQEIEFNQLIPEITYLEASNELDLNSLCDLKHRFSTNSLDLEDTVTYNINYATRFASNQLDFISSFVGVTDKLSLCGYNPFIGSTTDPAAPQNRLNNPVSIDPSRRGVTLFYPWSEPTSTLELRGPDLSNRSRLEFQRIKRETRGGSLIVWADPMWPKNEKLVLSFSGLIETEAQNLLDFLQLSLGKELGLTDWEGNTWRVIAINPGEPFVRNRAKNISIGLEFEITLSELNGRSFDTLDLTDFASVLRVWNRLGTSTLLPSGQSYQEII